MVDSQQYRNLVLFVVVFVVNLTIDLHTPKTGASNNIKKNFNEANLDYDPKARKKKCTAHEKQSLYLLQSTP